MSRHPRFRFFSLFIATLLLTFAMAGTAAARPVAPPPAPDAPPNDHQSTATQIRGLPYFGEQDTIGATSSATDPNCDADGFSAIDGHSVWHAFHASSTMAIRVTTERSDYDTVLSVYRVDGNGRTGTTLTQIGCDDDEPGIGLQSLVDFQAQEGESYLILTAAFGGGSGGTLHLNVFHNVI